MSRLGDLGIWGFEDESEIVHESKISEANDTDLPEGTLKI
jgi:hypothetical protein